MGGWSSLGARCGPALLTLAALAASGCTPPRSTEGFECVFNDECVSPLLCAAHVCRVQCRTDRDCPAGYLCAAAGQPQKSACLPATHPALCAGGADCPAGYRCADSLCLRQCAEELQCVGLAGARCMQPEGLCSVPPTVAQLRAPLGDASADATDASVDASPESTVDAAGMDAALEGAADARALDAAPFDASPEGAPLDVFALEADPRCDADLASSANNCGSCFRVCSRQPNASARCDLGRCVIECLPGFGDCDGDPSNGCEVPLTSGANCGACGVACPAGYACASGSCLRPTFEATGATGPLELAAMDGGTTVVVLPSGVHSYTTIHVGQGVVVRTDGEGVLDLRATGDIELEGTIDLSGGAGGSVVSLGCAGAAGGGGGTGTAVAGVTSDGVSCPAAASGGNGVVGGDAWSLPRETTALYCGRGGTYGGGNGGSVNRGGGGGGGYAGGGGAGRDTTAVGGAGGAFGTNSAGQGGGLGSADDAGVVAMFGGGGELRAGVYAGGNGGRSAASYQGGGGGGGSIGAEAAADLAVSSTFYPGSGGGGGAGVSTTCSGLNGTGGSGGGGGGGGALRLASATRIHAASTARLLVRGGAGGYSNTPYGGSGCGGGGSGGVLYLAAPTVLVDSSAVLSAAGGAGGYVSTIYPGGVGGAGGLGRIRVSAVPSQCQLRGIFTPPASATCAPSPAAGTPNAVYVAAYPD